MASLAHLDQILHGEVFSFKRCREIEHDLKGGMRINKIILGYKPAVHQALPDFLVEEISYVVL